jgi:5-methylcytosine-specific restriction protein A
MARAYRGGSAWDRASVWYRRRHPLCAACEANGQTTLATCVDHIIPHRGDKHLLWDKNNWQSLCDHCHNSIKKAREMGAHKEVDADGYPIDPRHRCYKRP